MRNFLIFLGIIAVAYLAVIDTMDRFEELEQIAVTTPAQVDMKPDLNKASGHDAGKKYDSRNLERSGAHGNRADSIKEQTQTLKNDVLDRTNITPSGLGNSAKGKYSN